VRKKVLHKFRLYIAGDAGNSALAIQNLNAICRAHLPGHYEIENVDVFKEPQRALADIIVMTPTLIKLSPKPMCRVIGTLSETKSVMHALGLTAEGA
jgi:circadian clock protein KaiB